MAHAQSSSATSGFQHQRTRTLLLKGLQTKKPHHIRCLLIRHIMYLRLNQNSRRQKRRAKDAKGQIRRRQNRIHCINQVHHESVTKRKKAQEGMPGLYKYFPCLTKEKHSSQVTRKHFHVKHGQGSQKKYANHSTAQNTVCLFLFATS